QRNRHWRLETRRYRGGADQRHQAGLGQRSRAHGRGRRARIQKHGQGRCSSYRGLPEIDSADQEQDQLAANCPDLLFRQSSKADAVGMSTSLRFLVYQSHLIFARQICAKDSSLIVLRLPWSAFLMLIAFEIFFIWSPSPTSDW